MALVSLLAGFAVAVSGYHPFVEDGGVYAAGVRKLLDPSLYPAWTGFVTEHLRFSVYAPLVASLVQILHLPLEAVLLGLYCGCTWATLWTGWMLVARVTESGRARAGGVALLACWLTLPIAGTSLILMDPYVTARSLTTPLVLLALAWAMDGLAGRRRCWGYCAVALALAAALHPLMAGYGIAAVLVLAALASRRRRLWILTLLAGALATGAVLQAKAPAESAAYVQVALTRYYWFPGAWEWYEQLGLIAPLLVLWLVRRLSPRLAQTGIALGGISLAVALAFSHEGDATHLVARLQPLRAYQVVYELMILLLGAWLGERVLQARAWRWAALLVGMGGVMGWAQRETFAHTPHLEWPGTPPGNAWQQAFVWAREHTPKDALFALDAHYITRGRGEDAQCFRAIAERSALPDYSKDGGEASITPDLTEAWLTGVTAQTGLETEPDAERERRLRPLGVSWAVLETASATAWSCPYANGTVKVCRIP